MKTPGAEAYRSMELWDAVRRDLLDAWPPLANLLEMRRTADWKSTPGRERATIALCCLKDLPPGEASARRKARQLLRSMESDGLVVSEQPLADFGADANQQPLVLTEKERARLAKSVEWIAGAHFLRDLERASGPAGAIQLLSRTAPAMSGRRAARFLAALGYPVVTVDTPRIRWMKRMGMLPAGLDGRAAEEQGLTTLMDAAALTGMTAGEMDLLTGIFTGAEPGAPAEAAWCVAQPRCSSCPAMSWCLYARLRHREDTPSSNRQNLRDAMPEEERPREKLVSAGATSLSDAELLAILLRTGTSRMHAVDLARRILREAESLDRLCHMSLAELEKLHGLGRVKAVTIKAAMELARRIRGADKSKQPILSNGRAVYEYIQGRFVERSRESFLCLLLTAKNRLIRIVTVSEGTLTQSLVHPREAFQDALKDSASAVIFVHNHPSGDPTPSRDDRIVTRRLVDAGDLLGIRVLDHVITGEGRFYSFADEGELRGN